MLKHKRKASKVIGTFGYITSSVNFIRKIHINLRSCNYISLEDPKTELDIELMCEVSEIVNGVIHNIKVVATIDDNLECIIDRHGNPINAINAKEMYDKMREQILNSKFSEFYDD